MATSIVPESIFNCLTSITYSQTRGNQKVKPAASHQPQIPPSSFLPCANISGTFSRLHAPKSRCCRYSGIPFGRDREKGSTLSKANGALQRLHYFRIQGWESGHPCVTFCPKVEKARRMSWTSQIHTREVPPHTESPSTLSSLRRLDRRRPYANGKLYTNRNSNPNDLRLCTRYCTCLK